MVELIFGKCPQSEFIATVADESPLDEEANTTSIVLVLVPIAPHEVTPFFGATGMAFSIDTQLCPTDELKTSNAEKTSFWVFFRRNEYEASPSGATVQ